LIFTRFIDKANEVKNKMKKLMRYALLFSVLLVFSSVALGLIEANDILPEVSALKEENSDATNFITVESSLFDSKVLRFLKAETVCALTEDQALVLSDTYPFENHVFEVDDESVNVLYLQGNPLNKEIVEGVIGEELDEECVVVHGNKMIALISPIFVS
jgi:hypothetical protein